MENKTIKEIYEQHKLLCKFEECAICKKYKDKIKEQEDSEVL